MSSTIISWNVNGYTPDIHSWLLSFAQTARPSVIFLSETKKKEDVLRTFFNEFTEYHAIINPHNPSHYHGVAMLIRKDHSYVHLPLSMNIACRRDSKDAEAATGRVIAIQFNKEMYIIGSYTPNSGQADHIKLAYWTQVWDPCFAKLLEMLRSSGPTLWIGDINVALDDIDVSHPVTMQKFAGFTLEERQNLQNLLDQGNWIDVWRRQHPEERLYTWRGRASGMRLDNIIASKCLLNKVNTTFAVPQQCSSDHIMIGVSLVNN